MINIRTREVQLLKSDYRDIIAARKYNEKLVREVLGAIFRYKQSLKETRKEGDEPLITEEELMELLAKECWTDIPPNWLSKDESWRHDVKLPIEANHLNSRERSVGEDSEDSETKARHHSKVDVNENYLVVLRERRTGPHAPFAINPRIALPLSFETLRARRILSGQPASLRKNSPPSVFAPLFSEYEPNNLSIDKLSEEEKKVFMLSVLPGRPSGEEKGAAPKESVAAKCTQEPLTKAASNLVEKLHNDRTTAQLQNMEDNRQRRKALLDHPKKAFRC